MTRVAACALVVTLAAACRPDVESSVPCASGGDLSCPTGFHCAPAGTCVRNAPISVDSTTSTPVGPGAGSATVVLSEAPAAPPVLEAGGLVVAGPVASEDQRTWTFGLRPGTEKGVVPARVTARSHAGDEAEARLEITVDLVAPTLPIPARIEWRLAGLSLRIACSEPATWSIGTPAATGSCDPTPRAFATPNLMLRDSLRVVDLAGNAATFAIEESLVEDPPALTAGPMRLFAGWPGPDARAPLLVSIAADAATLGSVDDVALTASTTLDTPAPARARPGPLRRLDARPITFGDATSGTLRFGLIEGAGAHARLALYAWSESNGAEPRGFAPVDAIARPAWDEAGNSLWFARHGRLFHGALFGGARDAGEVATLVSGTTDAVSCAGRYVAIGDGTAGSPVTLVAGPSEAAATFAAPASAASPSARLSCVSGTAVLLAPGATRLSAFTLASGTRAWAPADCDVRSRTGFAAGSDGLFASGTRAGEGLVRDAWRFDGAACGAVTPGPARAGATLVAGPQGSTLVVGGAGAGAHGLVASSAEAYAETVMPAPDGLRDESVAYDFGRDALVLLADDSPSASRVWDWSHAGGWAAGPAVPLRTGATLVARPQGGVLVTGGITAAGGLAPTAFAWDGAGMSQAGGVDVVGLRATVLADGRYAFAGGTDAGTQGTVEIRSANLAQSSRMTLGTGEVTLLAAPGRDLLAWTSGGLLHESRIGANAATPVGNVEIGAAPPVLLPGSGLFLAPRAGLSLAWRALPSTPGAVPVVEPREWPAIQGPCFSSPGGRRAVCITSLSQDPPVIEFDDRPHAAYSFAPAGAGAGHVELCARVDVGGTKGTDVLAFVIAGSEVARLDGTVSGTCRRFEADFEAHPDARILVVSQAADEGSPVTLELDAFSATRVTPIE